MQEIFLFIYFQKKHMKQEEAGSLSSTSEQPHKVLWEQTEKVQYVNHNQI